MTAHLSVIIPVYNGAAFVGRAVESVLSQTAQADEIIVVNDGSHDETAEVLARFESRITVISIPNSGVACARNTGIEASTGEWIAFLDADDVWFPNKLAIQLEAVAAYPQVGFSCCNYRHSPDILLGNHFTQFDRRDGFVFDAPMSKSTLSLMLQWNIMGTCSNVIVRRDVLDLVGQFDTSYRQSEDYDLWLRCATATDFLLTSEVLLVKETHDSNLTNDFLETLLYTEQVLVNLPLRYEAAARLIADMRSTYRRALANLRYEVGNLYYESGAKNMAFAYFLRGLLSDYSIVNARQFGVYFSHKLVRLASFDLIKRP